MSLRIYARVEYDGGRITERRLLNGWSVGYHGENPDARYHPPRVGIVDRLRLRLVRWLCDPEPSPLTRALSKPCTMGPAFTRTMRADPHGGER